MKPKPTSPLIMVADRDEMERGFLKAVLNLKGFRVIEAADGREVISLATKHRPVILLLDLKLPGLGGSAGIKRIRAVPGLRSLPIVALSRKIFHRRSNDHSTVHASRPIEFVLLDSLLSRFASPAGCKAVRSPKELTRNSSRLNS